MGNEIWKDIKGYESLYKISNKGRVKSMQRVLIGKDNVIKYHKEIILKGGIDTNGYHLVQIRNNNRKTCKIHRLVAEAFIPNPEKKLEVNHINGIKTDNRVENLEWSTRIENQRHAFKNGLAKGLTYGNNPNSKKVINKLTGEVYDSASFLSKKIGLGYTYLAGMLNGSFKNKTPYEYI